MAKRSVSPTPEAAAAIGNVLNAAATGGGRIFGAERDELVAMRRRGEELIALLPSRVIEKRGADRRCEKAGSSPGRV